MEVERIELSSLANAIVTTTCLVPCVRSVLLQGTPLRDRTVSSFLEQGS